MSKNIVVLGKDCVRSSVYEKLDYLMCCFFFSQTRQSTLYRGKIQSLTDVLVKYSDDSLTIGIAIENAVRSTLSSTFDTVTVSTSTVVDRSTGDVSVSLNTSVADADTATAVNLGYALTVNGSTLLKIINATYDSILYGE